MLTVEVSLPANRQICRTGRSHGALKTPQQGTKRGLSYQQWHYALAFVAASEISILANFFPNDAITFRRLPGHSRPWLVRCLRFHATYLLGTLLQLLLAFGLHLSGCPAVFAQGLAIALVTAFNFAFHHIFTYRGERKHHTVLLDHVSKSSRALRSMNSQEGE